MDKNGVLTISDFQKGQADSPYLGFDTIRAVDITSTPGVAKVSYKPSNSSRTGLVVAQCYDASGNFYELVHINTPGGVAEFYKNGTSIATLTGAGWDMIYHKGYILIRHGAYLSAYETTAVSPTIFQSGSTLNISGISGLSDIYYAKILVSKNDGNIYISNGTNIKRISSFTAGASGVSPTGTMDTAITLISGYAATTIAELGSRLMIGTQTVNDTWYNRFNSTEATIFPYRIGVSATNFDNPVTIANANCIQQMITSNNLLYITAGMKGNLYVSDGTSYRQVKTIPFTQKEQFGVSLLLYPNAITIGTNGNLYIGTTSFSNGWFGDATQHGIYEVNLATGKYETSLKYITSNGNYTGNTQISIGSILQFGADVLKWGWGYGSTYGLNNTTYAKYESYIPTIETQLYRVGNKLEPKNFQNIEILFGQPLTAGQGIKVSYRKDTVSSYTEIGTWDYSTEGGVISIRKDAVISDAELLQIKIQMTTTTSLANNGLENIELLSVTFW